MHVASRGIGLSGLAVVAVSSLGFSGSATLAHGNVGVVRARADGVPTGLRTVVHAEFNGVRMEEIFAFLTELSGVLIDAGWEGERVVNGLDPDTRITVAGNGLTLVQVIERVLQRASDTDACTWQIGEHGELQVGPKSWLNAHRTLVVYDVSDLVMVVPSFTNAPQIDLQAALQGNGQGSSSLFREPSQQTGSQTGFGVPIAPREARVAELALLIQELVEQNQWKDYGGDGATMRVFQDTLLVNAPEYIHRQIRARTEQRR